MMPRKGYWASPEKLLEMIRDIAPIHVSREFLAAMLESEDDKREVDTTIRDELEEYNRE